MPLVTSSSTQGNLFRQSSAPATATNGDVWVDTTTGAIYTFDGSNWIIRTAIVQSTYPTPVNSGSHYNTTTSLTHIYRTRPVGWFAPIDDSTKYLNDDFTTYSTQAQADAAWASADTAKNRVNITNDNIDISMVADSSNDSMAFDLGAAANDTAWVLRFKIRFSALTQGANAEFVFGLSSTTQATNYNTAQDSILVQFDNIVGTTIYASKDSDGAAPQAGSVDNSQALVWATDTDYFFELIRSSATAFTINRYTTSAYTTIADTVAGTAAATTVGLRYIKLMNFIATGAGTWTGTIDDVIFADGVTSL